MVKQNKKLSITSRSVHVSLNFTQERLFTTTRTTDCWTCYDANDSGIIQWTLSAR